MPLIKSPRHTRRDLETWERLEAYDQALADRLPITEMEDKAWDVIAKFWEQDPGVGYASTSWGKDSTVLAHLIAQLPLDIPLVWVRVERWENPECELVRDQYLDLHPHMRDRYHEIIVPATARRWWHPDAETESKTRRTSRGGFDQAAARFGARHISGIRAEESRVRRIAQSRWGHYSDGACRPIGTWKATDVFAYLYARGLPVHPAYAMSVGGALDRRWLRVSSLGGVRGADRGRAEWEARYYPDVIYQEGGAPA